MLLWAGQNTLKTFAAMKWMCSFFPLICPGMSGYCGIPGKCHGQAYMKRMRIALAKLDGSLLKVVNHIERNDLVIFDDFGLQPLDNNSRLALLQILEDCYQRKSVIVTSQLPVSKWYDYISEPTLADAILDRLLANASRIELKGDSMRRKTNKK